MVRKAILPSHPIFSAAATAADGGGVVEKQQLVSARQLQGPLQQSRLLEQRVHLLVLVAAEFLLKRSRDLTQCAANATTTSTSIAVFPQQPEALEMRGNKRC